MLILDIDRSIPKSAKDTELKEKLFRESDYAIHMAMLALRQLYKDQHFAQSDHSRECIEKLYRSADSVKAFIDDMLCHKSGEKMKRSDIYKMYEDYCEDNGRKPHGKSKFWEYMADKGFMIKRYSDGAYYFKDTAIRESDFETIDDTINNPFEQLDLSIM